MANMDKFFAQTTQKAAPKAEAQPDQSDKPQEGKEEQLSLLDKPKDSQDSQRLESKKEKKKFKVKVYGQEKEVEVGDDDIPEYIQKAMSSDEKWKQALAKERELTEKFEKIKAMEEFMEKNPDMFFRQKYGDQKAQEYYEQQVLRAMELERMSPEKREEFMLQERLSKLREEAKKEEERYAQIEAERQEKYFSQYFQDMAKRNLEKVGFQDPSNLVWNKFIMMMRSYLGHNEAEGINEEEVAKIAELVRDDTKAEVSSHLQKMTADELKEILGPVKWEEIRKAHLVSKPIANAQEVLSQEESQTQIERKKMTPEESRKFWRSLNT